VILFKRGEISRQSTWLSLPRKFGFFGSFALPNVTSSDRFFVVMGKRQVRGAPPMGFCGRRVHYVLYL